ncbi:MAG: hypothetical protein JO112_05330 [Planctomycetes bacterium]|nr:hypothetical protein [Planctomycetota bacterium]
MGLADSPSGADKLPLEELWQELFRFFQAHGYLCRPCRKNKAGQPAAAETWGVRFVLEGVRQARELEGLLRQAAYPLGKTLRRHGKWVVWVPGPEAVELVAELWMELGQGRKTQAHSALEAERRSD